MRKPRPSPKEVCWDLLLGLRCNLKRFGCLCHRLQEWLALLWYPTSWPVWMSNGTCVIWKPLGTHCINRSEDDLWQLMPFAFFGDTVILPSAAVLTDVLVQIRFPEVNMCQQKVLLPFDIQGERPPTLPHHPYDCMLVFTESQTINIASAWVEHYSQHSLSVLCTCAEARPTQVWNEAGDTFSCMAKSRSTVIYHYC